MCWSPVFYKVLFSFGIDQDKKAALASDFNYHNYDVIVIQWITSCLN